jgi:hypothetical protein
MLGVYARALFAALLGVSASAAAQTNRETRLLEVVLRPGRTESIDRRESPAQSELDAELDRALGGVAAAERSFSTRILEPIELRIIAEERRERLRAQPELIIFLYPGRVSAERLRTLTEVFVDLELVIDPCDRSVCREAVAHHIEVVGRAVGQAAVQTPRYKLVWKTLIIKTMVHFHDPEAHEYRIPIPECVAAAARPGGGSAWLESREHAEVDYEATVSRAIAAAANRSRVLLWSPPSVSRSGGEAAVDLRIRADRNRFEQQVIDALAAAATGLRQNPATPAQTVIDVTATVQMRGPTLRHWRAPGPSVGLYLDDQISKSQLWSTYVQEIRKDKDAQTLRFGDDEARGAGGPPDEGADTADGVAALAANFGLLGECARAEATRNRHFAGVTLTVHWLPSGVILDAVPKEPALRGGELARCLRLATSRIRLPPFSGAPRTIEYPILIKSR